MESYDIELNKSKLGPNLNRWKRSHLKSSEIETESNVMLLWEKTDED